MQAKSGANISKAKSCIWKSNKAPAAVISNTSPFSSHQCYLLFLSNEHVSLNKALQRYDPLEVMMHLGFRSKMENQNLCVNSTSAHELLNGTLSGLKLSHDLTDNGKHRNAAVVELLGQGCYTSGCA